MDKDTRQTDRQTDRQGEGGLLCCDRGGQREGWTRHEMDTDG